jgi:hypothetical protein
MTARCIRFSTGCPTRSKDFEDVERIHGAAPRQRLEQDVMALWIKEKDQTA